MCQNPETIIIIYEVVWRRAEGMAQRCRRARRRGAVARRPRGTCDAPVPRSSAPARA